MRRGIRRTDGTILDWISRRKAMPGRTIKCEATQYSSVQVRTHRDFRRSTWDLLACFRQLRSRQRLDSHLAVSARTAQAMVAAISRLPGVLLGTTTSPAGVREELLTHSTSGMHEVGFPFVPRTKSYVRHASPRGQAMDSWLGCAGWKHLCR